MIKEPKKFRLFFPNNYQFVLELNDYFRIFYIGILWHSFLIFEAKENLSQKFLK